MTDSDSELLDGLTDAISFLVPSIFGDHTELVSVPPMNLHRRYSFIYRYWVRLQDGGLKPLLVKIPHESWMVTLREAISSEHIREVVENEFEAMVSIANAISESGRPMLVAIRPRSLSTEFNALIMDEVPIRMLKTSLQRISIILGMEKSWWDLSAHLQLAGEWLKVIHDRYATGKKVTLASLGMIEKLDNDLKILGLCQAGSMSKLRELFLRLYNSLGSVQIPVSCLHNDYHPGNIYVTQAGEVGALDPNWIENGSIYMDLATLMIYPMTRKTQVLTQGYHFRFSLRMKYEKAILRGYFGDSIYPYHILYFYCAAAALEKWRDNEELLKTSHPRLYSINSRLLAPLIRSYFHRLIVDYLEQGLKA